MIKNIKILIFTIYLFSFMYANTCNTAEDYGLINSGTILSGNFSSDGDDYWISFTTTCEFQNILLSTCGSYAENTNDGISAELFAVWAIASVWVLTGSILSLTENKDLWAQSLRECHKC